MTYPWSKTVFPIAAIFAFRMLGLFLLIPVFTLYANHLQGASPVLIGFALGGYGLTQGILQMPFGMLSDRFGRKSIISFGLIIFALGSLLGALTDSIYGMILARILQGGGAIGSVLIALLADLTLDEQRTQAMAIIGMSIGISFSLAMVISPALAQHYGLAGIFYLTMILAVLGIVLVHALIPDPHQERFHTDSNAKLSFIQTVFKNPDLQRLNLGIFCQHFILTATFFSMPLILNQLQVLRQWHFYLPLMICSFIAMVPFILLAEKKKIMKWIFLMSVALIALSQALLAVNHSHWIYFCLLMFAYFLAFNILEASLPSLVSRHAGSNYKGTAMGIYSTGQFLGIFSGGLCAGLVYAWAGNSGIFIANAILAGFWFLIALFMKTNYLSTLILSFPKKTVNQEACISAFLRIPGIKEVSLSQNEQVVYLRIDKEVYQIGSAEALLTKIKT